jgi:hypothetical protein
MSGCWETKIWRKRAYDFMMLDSLNLTVALWNSTRVLGKPASARHSPAIGMLTVFAGGLLVWLLAATSAYASPTPGRASVCGRNAGSLKSISHWGLSRKSSFTVGKRASRIAWLTRRLVHSAVVPHIHDDRVRPTRENGPATIEGDRVVVGGNESEPLVAVLRPLGILVSPNNSRPTDRTVSRRRPRGPPQSIA